MASLKPKSIAAVQLGSAIATNKPARQVTYDGTKLTAFLFRNGVNPQYFRQVLWDSQVGSAFDLEVGDVLSLRQEFSSTPTFSINPET